MSLTIASSDSAARRTVEAYSCWSVRRPLSSNTPVIPTTAFMGVRISWLMRARNSLLARLASSARARAASASAVRSRTVPSRSESTDCSSASSRSRSAMLSRSCRQVSSSR